MIWFIPIAFLLALAAVLLTAKWLLTKKRRGTCRTCKWWDTSWADGTSLIPCSRLFGTCQHESADLSTVYEDGIHLATENNGGQVLMYGPDFGCIHHEKGEA